MKGQDNTIYPNVRIGEGAVIHPPCCIGVPPRGKEAGELPTIIGNHAVIRSFTTIYAGVVIGDGFQSGHGVMIREDNVIGDNVSIGTGSVLEFGNRIKHNSRIHSGCFLESVTVGSWVFIGPNSVFTDDPHPMLCPRYLDCLGGVTLRDKARIGANATILPGVTIGEDSLVGAGAVVTKDVPDGAVVAGNPARVINRVDRLTCPPAFFERPYLWPPYAK